MSLELRQAMLVVLESAGPKQDALLKKIDDLCEVLRGDLPEKRATKIASTIESLSLVLYNNEISYHNMRRMVLGLEPNMKVIR